MEFIVSADPLEKQATDCLVVGVYQNALLSPSAMTLDQISGGFIQQLITQGDMNAQLGQTLLIHQLPNITAPRVLLVGCGESGKLDKRGYQTLITQMVRTLSTTGTAKITCCLNELDINDCNPRRKITLAMTTIGQANYQFESFKQTLEKPATQKWIQTTFLTSEVANSETALQEGIAIIAGLKVCRDVANAPPNICTPAYLAQHAQDLAEQFPDITTEIINARELKELGMHAYLAVAQGSDNEAMMSIMHYKGAGDKNAAPIVLVGKGLTFDAGGISLKPAESMDEMKYDMCGAASVLGVMHAIARIQPNLNVIGILAGAENMPDGRSYRPGDILKTLSGQTVEVLNTDAEGRLVLCDVLTYIERYSPEAVIDIATLTGACIIALGHHISGLMSTNEPLAQQLLQASQATYDRAWRLPLSPEYDEQLESPFADLANIGGRPAGSITAGAFLSHFTKNYPWAHLDIAGTAWKSGGKEKGATGRPVPLLVEFLLNRAGH